MYNRVIRKKIFTIVLIFLNGVAILYSGYTPVEERGNRRLLLFFTRVHKEIAFNNKIYFIQTVNIVK